MSRYLERDNPRVLKEPSASYGIHKRTEGYRAAWGLAHRTTQLQLTKARFGAKAQYTGTPIGSDGSWLGLVPLPDYTYYSFIEVVYEAITLSAFLLLLIEFVAEKEGRDRLLAEKEKRKLIFPFCCWRYRPTKPYFMYAVKWSVLQYVIVRPAVSLAGIICQALGVLCESQGFDAHFANVYLEAVDFVSISVALYGLLVFYGLTKDDLKGKKPLAKFLCIKLIVMFTWYQSFVFSALQDRVIHGTEFWTSTNIADGLNALAICIEMIFFAIFMWRAYPYDEYKRPKGARPTSIGRPLWDRCVCSLIPLFLADHGVL
ncbi:hypothetical protein CVT26_011631 [Gymnopilus dilepis]|uniref:Organic solute transporter Ostalpha-domain-containing protein n=1 Tax=Gymnopilus dilepis TaxID=231916 RepID=A0A409VXX8_9AGAR|nr:hypothetical protein CVT26_011631 [Gymnopilus dilepis]